jgi:hypothetical protein
MTHQHQERHAEEQNPAADGECLHRYAHVTEESPPDEKEK